MATKWYFSYMGKTIGPLGASELIERVRLGEVTESTLLKKDKSKWFPARQVNGLFESAFKDMEKDMPGTAASELDVDY